jgi:hypothetical protein
VANALAGVASRLPRLPARRRRSFSFASQTTSSLAVGWKITGRPAVVSEEQP